MPHEWISIVGGLLQEAVRCLDVNQVTADLLYPLQHPPTRVAIEMLDYVGQNNDIESALKLHRHEIAQNVVIVHTLSPGLLN